ncbi:ABC transporter [Desulfomarina profundi]|uniref:ABC transporter n=1 Tax=Desulfomarina profundi TaxID=2772557 RepID=A0A8D5JS22_9BACT|nr:ABC transporter permease [Desulfomarina profundi]BCL61641.1 ABC transporter [Desulfomarina profundi]
MKLLASINKELLLLTRDRAGLILLFIMPAFLVIIITLIQDQVTTTSAKILFVDRDGGFVAKEIKKTLLNSSNFKLIETLEGKPVTPGQAEKLVAGGQFHFSIVLPEHLSRDIEKKSDFLARKKLFPATGQKPQVEKPAITVWFDPTVQGSFRAALNSSLQAIIKGQEIQLTVKKFFALLPEKIQASLPPGMKSLAPNPLSTADFSIPELFTDSTFTHIEQRFATKMGFSVQPTPVQQNVPAWTIFGIFFIVLPLAGSIISERNSGTLKRLRIMPVSYFTVMAGKLTAFTLISLSQFAVILLASWYILPLFGVERFDAGTEPLAFAVVLLAVICAANGYGIFLGTFCRTYEQVSMFAPVSIVIAAAIGGVLVPVYALPDFIRPLSILSPLYWGQAGFYDLLLRQGDLFSILPEAGALSGFGILLCIIALARNRG